MAIDLPAKVLTGNITNQINVDLWQYDDGLGDKWWAGGSNPRFYTWDLEITLAPQNHGSHLTRQPEEYSGFDVKVGDWVAKANTGIAARVIGTKSKSATSITLTVEDVNRYNTFRAASGAGSLGTGPVIVFGLNEEGEPLLDTIPLGIISEVFFSNVQSRFQNLNSEYDFNLTQIGHLFQEGDLISADPINNRWVKSASEYAYPMGRISALGPTPDQFYFTPIQKVIDDLDDCPGDIASILYVDDSAPGGITVTEGAQPIYIKLRNESITSLTGEVAPVATTPGSVISINGANITFATGDQTDVLNSINAAQGTTGVTASVAASSTIISSVIGNTPNGFVGALGSATEITLNGVTVVFDDVVNGTAAFGTPAANEVDMAISINAASIPDISAVGTGGILIITHAAGGAINVVSVVPDGQGNPFAADGVSSVAGLQATNPANADAFLVLTGINAGPITLINVTGTPQEDLGIYTVENGQKAAAIYIEKGLAAASSTVVANIAGRDALTPQIGDQAMVLDKGNGEWELYLYDGSTWVTIANEDSARTDANSVEFILDATSTASNIITTVSTESRVTLITIEVITPFDGTPALSIGTLGDTASLFDDNLHDLSSLGTYASQTDTYYNSGVDTDIIATYTQGSATVGQAKIIVSYM